MKRVLVTGATGFIGTRTLTFLHERDYEVHVIGRTPPQSDTIIFHKADILNPEATRAVVAQVQATHLLHLAWDVTPGRYWQSADNLNWVSASLQLVRAFAEVGGQRAVISGTCAEYQWGQARFLESETPCIPVTLYGAAKDALRRILMAYAATRGLSVAWGRIFFLYGPGEKSGRLISDTIRTLRQGTPFPTSHGHQLRDFLHVDDVAGAFAALVDCKVSGPVNIGSGQAVSVRKILETLAAQLGNHDCIRFGERPLPEGEPEIIEADTKRLIEEVGFKPRFDLAGGLADTIAWWNCERSVT
jgi:nucleoside-diphosphate-sugar epimerase